MHKYRLISKKGEGTFSEVLKAQSIKTGRYVAIKCMKNQFENLDQVNSLREIQALRRLSPHAHIVKLHEVLYDEPTGRLALVFELMEMNMYEAIRGRRHYLPESKVKYYMWQLIKAMDHMHRNGIFHRDIKPENILILEDTLKLADFGSCRGIWSKQPYTEYISTRWYRAPECLLTDGYYNYKMDMWGVGCVLFEIMALFPLFPGTNELDQIQKIHNVLGTPHQDVLNKFKAKASHLDFNFPSKDGTGIARHLPQASPECIEILTRLLAYNPDERISARQALKHPYFKDLRDAEKAALGHMDPSSLHRSSRTDKQSSHSSAHPSPGKASSKHTAESKNTDTHHEDSTKKGHHDSTSTSDSPSLLPDIKRKQAAGGALPLHENIPSPVPPHEPTHHKTASSRSGGQETINTVLAETQSSALSRAGEKEEDGSTILPPIGHGGKGHVVTMPVGQGGLGVSGHAATVKLPTGAWKGHKAMRGKGHGGHQHGSNLGSTATSTFSVRSGAALQSTSPNHPSNYKKGPIHQQHQQQQQPSHQQPTYSHQQLQLSPESSKKQQQIQLSPEGGKPQVGTKRVHKDHHRDRDRDRERDREREREKDSYYHSPYAVYATKPKRERLVE